MSFQNYTMELQSIWMSERIDVYVRFHTLDPQQKGIKAVSEDRKDFAHSAPPIRPKPCECEGVSGGGPITNDNTLITP